MAGTGFAYEGNACDLGGDTHYSLAYDVFAVDSLKPYFNELIRYGGNSNYTYANWAKHSNWEPDPQHSWGYLFDNSLYNFNLNDNSTGWNLSRGCTTTGEFTFGALLHALADSAVPCKHAPVEWEFDEGHDYWESQAVGIVPGYTAKPSPTEYLTGSFGTKEISLYALKSAYVAEFQRFWNGTPPYRSLTELQYEAVKTMQIAADAVLKQYFDKKNLLTPEYVVADWTFDEGDSAVYGADHQYIYNHRGSINANLVRGRTLGADIYDGTWDTGYARTGAFHGALRSENGGGQTYCKSFNWTGYEGTKLTSYDSYTIEMIVSPDTLPATNAVDNDNPSTLINFFDAAGGTQWWLRGFRKINVGGVLHLAVSFGVETRDGGGRPDLFVDLTAGGMTVNPGQWYYIGIVYNYDNPTAQTGTLTLTVMDLATTQSVSANTACKRMKAMTSGSQPVMRIGGESDNGDLRPFDGRIDRLRISTVAVPYENRLHGSGTVAHWTFDENSGQMVQNTSGSSSIDLQFGSSTGSDTSDPTWTAGLSGSAMLGRKYTDGNVAVYSKNSGWSLRDAEQMAPGNSYSIEAIINPNWYAEDGTWNNVNPMGLVKYRDKATGGKTPYNIQTFTDNELHRKIRFYGQHADGSYTDFIFDPESKGLRIDTNKWYYVAAIYTDNGSGSGTLELIVRSMSTGAMVSGSASCKSMAPMTTAPNPEFLVGSEYTNSTGRSFSGKIDQVRISCVALPDSQRLYGGSHVGDWGYFKSDLDSNGYVNSGDLGIFMDYWLMPSYAPAGLVINSDAEWGYDYYWWSEGERPDLCTINRTDESSACFQISNAGIPDTRCDFGQTLMADVVPGEPVRLTFRYKTLPGYVIGGPGGAKLQLRFYDINNNWKGEHDFILTPTNGQWVTVEAHRYVLSEPSICRADICVKLRHWDTAEGTIRLDDIQLYNGAVPQPQSLVLNGGAESAVPFENWSRCGPSTIIINTDAVSGTRCYEMDNTSCPSCLSDMVSNRYDIAPLEPIIVSFYYKTLPGFSITDSCGFRLQPRFWDAAGNFKGEYNIDMTPTNGRWVKVAFFCNALRDSSVSKLDIRISLRDFGAAVGKARFDDIRIFTMDSFMSLEPLKRIDTDGFIDFTDFADFAAEWLLCSDPLNANCVHVLY
jgi:hypothetical protein